MAYTTINKSSLNFNTKLYTGNGNANNSITGVGFAPSWVWIKKRSGVDSHYIFDVPRGVDKQLQSNSTAAQYDYSGDSNRTLTAFGSDGFTLQTSEGVNHNNQTFASWNWKAGTSFSNSAGANGASIASTGSINTAAGFSIVKYTGNGSGNSTIGHGLGATPKFIIVKCISATQSWATLNPGFVSASQPKVLYLNQTGSYADDTNVWGTSAAFNNNTFTVGDWAGSNANSQTFIAYSFAEKTGYSKFGSYIGNGNANGTFVYTGFKPAFTLFKKASSGSGEWFLYDNKRLGFNVTEKVFEANSTSAEDSNSGTYIDYLSNGFKIRGTGGNTNSSGVTYIYMAFGQSIVGTNNVPATAR